MRRFHLFEWEDQPWLPRVFRDFMTDQLRYTSNEAMRTPVNEAIAARLKTLLDATGSRSIVDLGAGAGGPLVAITKILSDNLQCDVDVLLTDFYPNATAFAEIARQSAGRIRSRLESTDALDVPGELRGVRTLFAAFHHFRPEMARRILEDAVRKRAPIAIFEPLERTPRMLALLGIGSFVRGFTHTPRVGPLTPLRFLVTYVIPLAPALFAWDGMVSVLRSYTPDELLGLATTTAAANYRWDAGRFEVDGPYGLMPTTFLIGTPV